MAEKSEREICFGKNLSEKGLPELGERRKVQRKSIKSGSSYKEFV